MAKQGTPKARTKKDFVRGRKNGVREISGMLDSIRLDLNDLSQKPVAVRHTNGIKRLLRWCEDELKALRKHYKRWASTA
jgi:hypothetical protein